MDRAVLLSDRIRESKWVKNERLPLPGVLCQFNGRANLSDGRHGKRYNVAHILKICEY